MLPLSQEGIYINTQTILFLGPSNIALKMYGITECVPTYRICCVFHAVSTNKVPFLGGLRPLCDHTSSATLFSGRCSLGDCLEETIPRCWQVSDYLKKTVIRWLNVSNEDVQYNIPYSLNLKVVMLLRSYYTFLTCNVKS